MIPEQFSRIRQLIGSNGLQTLRRSFVAVFGLGAVGSYAVEALARSGVGRLRVVDFDQIRPTNLNRQILALQSTIGQKKCEVARNRILDIQPDCQVEALETFVHSETLETLLSGPPDVLIDAIDSLNPKVELLSAAVHREMAVISCMGAALRTDPTCVRVGPLSDIHHCRLALQIRKRLRSRGTSLEFTCVYSIERQDLLRKEAILESETDLKEYVRGRRRRALGSLPTLPGIFGLVAANEVLRILLGSLWPGKQEVA